VVYSPLLLQLVVILATARLLAALLRFVDADMITDAQLSYAFSGNMFEGLQILFQVNNLTNEPYIAYSENKQRVLDYQEYGTQYLLGLNYRF
jgi:iron complex outermembrane recepter protein